MRWFSFCCWTSRRGCPSSNQSSFRVTEFQFTLVPRFLPVTFVSERSEGKHSIDCVLPLIRSSFLWPSGYGGGKQPLNCIQKHASHYCYLSHLFSSMASRYNITKLRDFQNISKFFSCIKIVHLISNFCDFYNRSSGDISAISIPTFKYHFLMYLSSNREIRKFPNPLHSRDSTENTRRIVRIDFVRKMEGSRCRHIVRKRAALRKGAAVVTGVLSSRERFPVSESALHQDILQNEISRHHFSNSPRNIR